jgi:hypothetical protein
VLVVLVVVVLMVVGGELWRVVARQLALQAVYG